VIPKISTHYACVPRSSACFGALVAGVRTLLLPVCVLAAAVCMKPYEPRPLPSTHPASQVAEEVAM
jgi:hypothetical protein